LSLITTLPRAGVDPSKDFSRDVSFSRPAHLHGSRECGVLTPPTPKGCAAHAKQPLQFLRREKFERRLRRERHRSPESLDLFSSHWLRARLSNLMSLPIRRQGGPRPSATQFLRVSGDMLRRSAASARFKSPAALPRPIRTRSSFACAAEGYAHNVLC